MKCEFTSDELYLIQIAVRSYLKHDLPDVVRYDLLKERMLLSVSVVDKVVAYLSGEKDFDIL